MNCLKIVLTIALLCLTQVANAEPSAECRPLDSATGLDLLKKVQVAYEKLNSFEASFVQNSYMLGLDERRESQGRMAFKKTARMDWQYQAPVEQRFVTDGKKVWFFQPDLNQVSIGEFKQAFSSDLPVSFLLGLSTLTDSFELSSVCQDKENIKFTLNPSSSDASISSFELQVGRENFLPHIAQIIDVGGNENTIELTFLQKNEDIPDEQFVFSVPKGVDVLMENSNNSASLELSK